MSADMDAGHELVAHGADKIASFADVNGFRHAAARLLTVADDMRGADAPGLTTSHPLSRRTMLARAACKIGPKGPCCTHNSVLLFAGSTPLCGPERIQP